MNGAAESIPAISKAKLDAGLLHYRVGGVTGQRSSIYRKCAVGDWAVPNFMITFTRTLKHASGRLQGLYDLPVEAPNH